VGGYFGGSYLVEFDLSCRKVSWIHWEEGKQIATYHKTIRIETVRNFINKLKSVNLLDWIFRYEQPDVCDGTHWNVEYINWRILIDMRQLIYN
jgi:hypothetical protein